MKNTLTFLSVFLLLGTLKLAAQTEYLVKLDLATGGITKIRKIDGVAWIFSGGTTYDELHGRYIFWGTDANQINNKLYSIDVKTGNVVNKPSYIYNPVANTPFNYCYLSLYDTIYGYRQDNITGGNFLVSIDPVSGNYKDLMQVQGVGKPDYDRIGADPANKTFYLKQGLKIYKIDLKNQTLTSITIPTVNYYGFQYDISLNKMFCTYQQGLAKYFAEVNLTTGTLTNISTLTAIQQLGTAANDTRYGYDQKHHYFIINAIDNALIERLYTIDVTNGQIVYSPPYPQPSSGGNLIYPKCDPVSGNVYALYWENPSVPVCDAPDTVNCTPISDSTALVYWNNVSGVSDYEYYVAPSPSTPPAHGTPVSGTLGFTPTLKTNTKYDVCVRSVCDTNLTSSWVCTSITLKTVGIDNINMQTAQVYPNPVKENLIIDKALGSFAALYNITGQQLYTSEIKTAHHTFDMTSFPIGVYILQLRDANGNTTVGKLQKE